jgi:dihydroorotate dehydrogenase
MGFNNAGHDAVFARLKGAHVGAILGVNIGANKDSSDFVADYVSGVTRFSEVADYLTVNISSPNTPGLRNLQSDEALKRLLRSAEGTFQPAGADLSRSRPISTNLTASPGRLPNRPRWLDRFNTTVSRDAVMGWGTPPDGRALRQAAVQSSPGAGRCASVGALPIIGGGIHCPRAPWRSSKPAPMPSGPIRHWSSAGLTCLTASSAVSRPPCGPRR